VAERVKIYEEKKRGLPLWAWLLPLLLLLALLAYFLSRHRGVTERSEGETPTVSQTSPAAFPELGTVHFEADQVTLTTEGEATLQRAARAMQGNPNVHLRLEGYADSTGDAAHNESLSDRRTKTVADYLQSQGIDRSRLTGAGFGAERPVDTNATARGKAEDRRVELFSQQ